MNSPTLINLKIVAWFKLLAKVWINRRKNVLFYFHHDVITPPTKISNLRFGRALYSTTYTKISTAITKPMFTNATHRLLSLSHRPAVKNLDRVSSRTKPPRAVAGVQDRQSTGGRAAPPRGELVLLLAPHQPWKETHWHAMGSGNVLVKNGLVVLSLFFVSYKN